MSPAPFALTLALKGQLRKDRSPEHQELFRGVLRGSPLRGAIYRFLEARSPRGVKFLICLFYGLAAARQRLECDPNQSLLIVGKQNDRICLGEIQAALGASCARVVEWRRPRPLDFLVSLVKLASPLGAPEIGRLGRIILRIASRHGLFISMRMTETLFCYLELMVQLRKMRPTALFVSTEGNPYGLSVMAAGEASGIPVVYVAHSATLTSPGRIRCALAILYGQRSQEAFLRAGAGIRRFMLQGFSERLRPLSLSPLSAPSTPLSVCICLSKSISPQEVISFTRGLALEVPLKRVTLRMHPDSVAREFPDGIVLSRGRSLDADLAECDLAFAANSNVHLDLLLRGIPTVFVPQLEPAVGSPLQFISDGLVPRCDSPEGVRKAVLKHYSSSGWEDLFASYLNIRGAKREFRESLRVWLASLKTLSESGPTPVHHEIRPGHVAGGI